MVPFTEITQGRNIEFEYKTLKILSNFGDSRSSPGVSYLIIELALILLFSSKIV